MPRVHCFLFCLLYSGPLEFQYTLLSVCFKLPSGLATQSKRLVETNTCGVHLSILDIVERMQQTTIYLNWHVVLK